MTLVIQSNSRRYTFDSMAGLRLLSGQKLKDNEIVNISGHTTEGSGGGDFFWDAASTATDDNGTIVKLADTTTGRFIRTDLTRITLDMFGGNGDGATDNTTVVGVWLDYLIANDVEGWLSSGVYAIATSVTKTINSGIRIRGEGTLKATGSNRLNMLILNGVTGSVSIARGLTIDADNKVARPLEILNESSTSSTLGSVYVNARIVNCKNNSPDTNTVSPIRVKGGFETFHWGGEVDGVDDDRTTGAATLGPWSDWYATAADDWVREFVVLPTSKIKNVKNENSSLEDADGLQATAPTDKIASFVCSPGAYFENCKGRSIKSQVVKNAIDSPVIFRDAYDGLIEIDMQYAGGHCHGAQIAHDGVRVDYGISVTQNPTPDNTQASISDNELTVDNPPVGKTEALVLVNVTDSAVANSGVSISGNKVKGQVNYLWSARIADVAGNFLTASNNWAENVTTAFGRVWRFGSGTPALNLHMSGNSCDSDVVGVAVTNAVVNCIGDYSNFNIQALDSSFNNAVSATIASGVINPERRGQITFIHVDTEASASTDDLDTITATNFNVGDVLILSALDSARTVVAKDNTGNLRTSGDFSMDNLNDTFMLCYNGVTFKEVSRSDNDT